eukprot:CAMPEP_0168403880 /NCGR_PEP_ID=MMETSP0228-20121227/24355_1 /TAXON_ID=133427 /ORGANISM="Protoceratium reticulatum, Strain CCCM 535 (=CCMP 1889)" /LENGTH=57 /DNA_ID=CAMNT_0008417493 /DNA_START=67 /DNA_END=237 /DNA_ORIENTATION=+
MEGSSTYSMFGSERDAPLKGRAKAPSGFAQSGRRRSGREASMLLTPAAGERAQPSGG